MSSIIKQIKKAEKIPLSDDDIRILTDGKVSIYVYEDLEGFSDINDLLGEFGAVILLYQTKFNFGHWVALFKVNETTLEFYDSLGWNLDQELKLSSFNLRVHNGNEVFHLTHLIETSNYKVINNNTALQKDAKDDNTCGRWAGLRIRLRHIPLKKFVAMFQNLSYENPDFWVSALTIMFS
jgi:hypothetical protein